MWSILILSIAFNIILFIIFICMAYGSDYVTYDEKGNEIERVQGNVPLLMYYAMSVISLIPIIGAILNILVICAIISISLVEPVEGECYETIEFNDNNWISSICKRL